MVLITPASTIMRQQLDLSLSLVSQAQDVLPQIKILLLLVLTLQPLNAGLYHPHTPFSPPVGIKQAIL